MYLGVYHGPECEWTPGKGWVSRRSWDTVLVLETEYEGAELPVVPSSRGIVTVWVRQLRGPAVFREGGGTYLLYAVAGEQGIAIARVKG